MKKINIYQLIILSFLVVAVTATVFNFTTHKLLAKSAVELADSSVYYFRSIFSEEPIVDQRISFLSFDESIVKSVVPINITVFGYHFLSFWEIMFNGDFASLTWSNFFVFLANFAKFILLIALPVVVLFVVIYNLIYRKIPDSDPEKESVPLKIFLYFKKYVLDPVTTFCKNLWFEFVYGAKRMFFLTAIILVLYNLNIISFVLSFFAWYLYFVFSIDFVSIWYLFVKLLICLSPLLKPIFWPLWFIVFIALIIYLKIKSGFRRLEDMYEKNDEFVEELGIITGIYGVPGSGKNLLEIAIATQKEVLLRRQAESSMMEIRSEFPDFPFRSLEAEVESLFNGNEKVNKIQIEKHFERKFKDLDEIYGYDLKTKKNAHYDQLKVADIKSELTDYAQLYYIYISALASSTYSLRYDKGIVVDGNFPSLTYDFFHRDFRDDHNSENAKIFDLNLIRLQNQVDSEDYDIDDDKKDKNITLFDFGLLTLSEFGKDRGNRYTNIARKEQKVKPFNDGLANCLGVLRHLTTVRYKQYGFIIWDDQKLSSFSGYESAMAETNIFITGKKSNNKLALPLWWIESILLQWFSWKFNNRYSKYIRLRNDKTLYSYYVGHCSSFFNNLTRNINSIFGYRRMSLSLSGVNVNGAQESRGESSFFLMNKIVFSNRYRTDCYKGFFDKLKMQAKKGINQFDSFEGNAATIDELIKTRGYFASELAQSVLSYVEMNDESNKKKEDSAASN